MSLSRNMWLLNWQAVSLEVSVCSPHGIPLVRLIQGQEQTRRFSLPADALPHF